MAARWVAAALLLCAAVASVHAADARIEVLAAPSYLKFDAKDVRVKAGDVAASLAHLAGLPATLMPGKEAAEVLPAGSPLDKPKGAFVAVITGDASSLNLPTIATVSAPVLSDASHSMLSTLLSGNQHSDSMGTLMDAAALHHDASLIISMSSSRALLSAASVHPEIAGTNHVAILIDAEAVAAKLVSPGSDVAYALLNSINDALAVLDFAEEGKRVPVVEQVAATALIRALAQRKETGDLATDLVLISFTADKESTAALATTLEQLSQAFVAVYGGDAVTQALVVPPATGPFAHAERSASRTRRDFKGSDYVSTYTCYDNQTLCESQTNNCTSNQGVCILYKKSSDPLRECWRCQCDSTYAGEQCQYYNMVSQFTIIFFLTVALAIVAVHSFSLLAQMDSGTETILYRTALRPKKASS